MVICRHIHFLTFRVMIDKIKFYFRQLFSSEKRYYRAVHQVMSVYPDNIEIYKLALIHRSSSVVLEDGTHVNNERLEYLGDAIIEAVVSDMLYIEYPFHNEGFLTQMRSKIVSRQSLNDIAVKLGLDKMLIAVQNYANSRKHIYGDAFEAMIGAIYLDKGYDAVNRLLINDIFRRHIDMDKLTEVETDYKSRLFEWGQKRHKKITISHSVNRESSVDADDMFSAIVSINGRELGYGIGSSKKQAEQRGCMEAARALGLNFAQGERQQSAKEKKNVTKSGLRSM